MLLHTITMIEKNIKAEKKRKEKTIGKENENKNKKAHYNRFMFNSIPTQTTVTGGRSQFDKFGKLI